MLGLLASHAVLSLCAAPPSVPFADVFVDGSAVSCSTATGAPGSPFCTIAEAIATATAGDTVRIAPGKYVENIVISVEFLMTAARRRTNPCSRRC